MYWNGVLDIKIRRHLLVAISCLGLTYGGFSYTKETTSKKLGPLELKIEEKETVSFPLIVSAGAIAIGVYMLGTAGLKAISVNKCPG